MLLIQKKLVRLSITLALPLIRLKQALLLILLEFVLLLWEELGRLHYILELLTRRLSKFVLQLLLGC